MVTAEVTQENIAEMSSENGAPRIDIDPGAKKAAEDAAAGFSATLLEKLADRIGAHSGVAAVYGDPVEKDAVTVVPVAQSMWGSGAGSGESPDEGGGSGGGGGAMSRALGYIEVGPDGARFVPLQRPWQDAKLILAYAFSFWLVARAIRRLIRR